MPKPPLPQNVSDFLAKPNPAVMATVRPDGQPVSVATWYLWDDDRLLVNMDQSRKRVEHLRQDPRASLTVLADNWYSHVSLFGTVEFVDDPDLAGIDRIATHYTGKPYADRSGRRVNAWIDVERWYGWGEFKAS